MKSSHLSEAEKQNGKRTVLIPSPEIQAMMEPLTLDAFAALVRKTIPPSSPSPTEAKQT